MAWPIEEAFEIDLAPSEKRYRFVLCNRQHAGEFAAVASDLHAPAAAARGSFDKDRVADFICCRLSDGEIAHRARRTGYRRNAEPGCCRLGGHFVAHQPDMLRRRTDEDKAVLFDGCGKVGVLREKSQPGMD